MQGPRCRTLNKASCKHYYTIFYDNARRRFLPYAQPYGRILEGFIWTLTELSNAFNRLKMQTLDSTKFWFFIDGLDEYEGDHTELIALVKYFASSSDIKICFSCRPWNVFEQAYGDNAGLKLRLQDLTHGDITCFVTEKLAEEPQFRRLKAEDNRYGNLVNEIVERVHGVFCGYSLWYCLSVAA